MKTKTTTPNRKHTSIRFFRCTSAECKGEVREFQIQTFHADRHESVYRCTICGETVGVKDEDS